MKPSITFFQSVSLASVLLLASCTSQKKLSYLGKIPETGSQETFLQDIPNYRIKPRDVLYITVKAMGPEGVIKDFLSGGNTVGINVSQGDVGGLYGFDVNSEGNIILPAIGAVKVSGLTLEETKEALQGPVDKVFKNATVECKLLSFRYTVIGEVRSPGTFNNYSNYLTVLEAIGRAGGINDFGNRSRVMVVRPFEKGTKTFRINLQDNNLFSSEAYTLLPNDVIIVEPLHSKILSLNLSSFSFILGTVSTVLFLITFFAK